MVPVLGPGILLSPRRPEPGGVSGLWGLGQLQGLDWPPAGATGDEEGAWAATCVCTCHSAVIVG